MTVRTARGSLISEFHVRLLDASGLWLKMGALKTVSEAEREK